MLVIYIQQRIKNNVSQFLQKILSSTTVNIDNNNNNNNNINVSWAWNHHIWMISEGSCDTEDWSNDAENSAWHHKNKLHF